jgi:hypothetical protein
MDYSCRTFPAPIVTKRPVSMPFSVVQASTVRVGRGSVYVRPGSVAVYAFMPRSFPAPVLVRPLVTGRSIRGPIKTRDAMARRVDGLIWPRQIFGSRPEAGILVPRRGAGTPANALVFDDSQTLVFDDGQVLVLD